MKFTHYVNRPFYTILDQNYITEILSEVKNVDFYHFWASVGRLGHPHGHIISHHYHHSVPFKVKYHHNKNLQKRSSGSWDIQIWLTAPPTFSVWASLGMPMSKSVISNTFTAFLSWYYIIIQNIIENGQAVQEILNFEKSSDLIGWKRFAP